MKSKQTLKYKYSRKEALKIARDNGYGYSTFEKYLLAKKSTPKKKSKEIKPIKNQDSAGYFVDVNNQLITIKLNELIDTINLLIKNK